MHVDLLLEKPTLYRQSLSRLCCCVWLLLLPSLGHLLFVFLYLYMSLSFSLSLSLQIVLLLASFWCCPLWVIPSSLCLKCHRLLDLEIRNVKRAHNKKLLVLTQPFQRWRRDPPVQLASDQITCQWPNNQDLSRWPFPTPSHDEPWSFNKNP